MKFNWQQKDWPEFRYNLGEIEGSLTKFIEETGYLSGMLNALPEGRQLEAVLNQMVSEAVKTSEIEGEFLSRKDVISSIRNKLGLNKPPERVKDKMAQGIGELMVAVRNTFAAPLNKEVLFAWHKMLLGESSSITVGSWRKHREPMQVISGPIGREKIHFEAPPSVSVPGEMQRFTKWFNDTAPGGKKEIKEAPVRSAIAHLYFESIHPFEDGNGRIGRAIAEKALSQTTGRPALLSLSQTIEANRKGYYAALQEASYDNEITSWIKYFVNVVIAAQLQSKKLIDFTLRKTRFFDRFKNKLNDRQLKIINRMLDEGPQGFKGGMSARKYISIAKTSKATATRDLQVMAEMGVLKEEGSGRNTHYLLDM